LFCFTLHVEQWFVIGSPNEDTKSLEIVVICCERKGLKDVSSPK
jgi:hypothetical protein